MFDGEDRAVVLEVEFSQHLKRPADTVIDGPARRPIPYGSVTESLVQGIDRHLGVFTKRIGGHPIYAYMVVAVAGNLVSGVRDFLNEMRILGRAPAQHEPGGCNIFPAKQIQQPPAVLDHRARQAVPFIKRKTIGQNVHHEPFFKINREKISDFIHAVARM